MGLAILNKQIFNVDETASHWEKIPARTLIAREEKSVPVLKEQADSLVKG